MNTDANLFSPAPEKNDRLLRAEKIIDAPEKHKICEGCESIVLMKSTTCPSCHGYRFDTDPIRVIAQARLLGSRAPSTVSWHDYL